MQLKDKTIIITGASSGIGKAAAMLFASEGANVVLGARRSALLEDCVERIETRGGHAAYLAGDVEDENYARALVTLAVDRFHHLDAAFNNAGIMGDMVPVPDMTKENWDRVIATNLSSAFLAAKYQVPALLAAGSGSIVFTSSFVGHTIGLPGMAAYAATKAGLIGLAQVLAVDHGSQGLRANALLPGGTLTPMAGNDAATLDAVRNFHALKRMAEPDEIARAALFLVSDASSFMTGSAMVVDGGNSISKV